MSKRFEELWAKANTQWVEEFEQAAEPRMCRTARDIFAELIVRECMNICVEQEEHWRDFGKIDVAMGAGICVDRLEQHFGVEE